MTIPADSVWFITGCSTGFGRELAKLVLDNGWRAVVTARGRDRVADLADISPDRAHPYLALAEWPRLMGVIREGEARA